jgi:hypothetical protein
MARAMRLAGALAVLTVLAVLAWPGSMRAAPTMSQGGPPGARQFSAGEGIRAKLVRPGVPFRNRFFTGRYGYGYEYHYPRYYVVAEKRGPEVAWSAFTMTYQVYDKVAKLRAEAQETAKADAALRTELVQLKSRVGALKAEEARENDQVKKQQLQAQRTQVEQTILAAESSVKPAVIWVVAGPYDQRQLDDFLVRLQREAGALHVAPAH